MLQLLMDVGGRPHTTQRHVEPMVYLDRWALRMFSDNEPLGAALRAALAARAGTLAVSWVNLAEFAKMYGKDSVQRAENLLESMFPHLFFIDPDPFTVIKREDAVLAGERLLPHADQSLLTEVLKLKPSSGL